MQPSEKPMTFKDLAPNLGERVSVMGLSGSGKTHFTMTIARYCKNVVVFDPKRELPTEGYNLITRPEELIWQMRFGRFPIMFRPGASNYDDPALYDRLFRQIFERGNITLIVDDVTAFCDANRFPRGLSLCCHQGRSKGVTVITISQGPTNIPACTYRQGTTFVIFYLNDDADRKKVQKYVRGYDALDLEPYEFFFYKLTFKDGAQKCILPEPKLIKSA